MQVSKPEKTHIVGIWPRYVMLDTHNKRQLVEDIELATKLTLQEARDLAMLIGKEEHMRARALPAPVKENNASSS